MMADQWFVWMVAMSWQVVALAALVWGLTLVLRKGSARVRWILWLLVMMKLVVSPGWATPWSLGTMADRIAMSAETDEEVVMPANVELAPRSARGDGGALELDLSVAFPSASAEAASPRLARLESGHLFAVWAVIAVSLMVLCIVQYVRFRRVVTSKWTDPTEELERFFAKQCGLMKFRGGVRLKVSPAIETPAVFGVFRPTVLLPEAWEGRFNQDELQSILVHELAHVRRGDLVWGWVVTLISCCYWFHPAVWLVNGMMRKEREMACDDVVLDVTGQKGETYASTLVHVAESFRGRVPRGVGVLGVLEVYDHLLHRVRSAADATRARGLGWRSVALFGVVAMLLPMGIWPASIVADSEEVKTGIDAEIAAHYSKAHPEVQEFIRWTAKTFESRGLWMDAGAYDELPDAERREKIAYLKALLEDGEYGRHLCEGVTQAGVLGDPALLDGVTKVAAYHLEDRDYDCRPKWMAVAALGRLDDERAVPTLVPLVDHGNKNTRMWARASLVRLTGQPFDTDKQAWADWWNGAGKEPTLGPDAVKPWEPPAPREQVAQAKSTPAPVLVKTMPVIGHGAVSPGLRKIEVTFDQDMAGGFSWTGGGEAYPELDGKPKWIDKRTCELPVKLKPGKFYRIGINARSFKNFKSTQGVPVTPTVLWFVTAGADGKPVSELQPPKVVALSPVNGAADVDAGTSMLTVTFDRPMAAGFSWTDPEGKAPDIPSKPTWSPDAKTCALPVKLVAGREYVMSLNLGWYLNFRSEKGVPLVPIRYAFSTR